MTSTVRRLSWMAADLALLPVTFLWWTIEYRWGLRMHSRTRPGDGLVRPIPSSETRDFAALFEKREPVVVTGLARDWRAFSSWTPASLAAALGDREVDVNMLFDDDQDFLQSYFTRTTTRMPFAELIEIVFVRRSPAKRYYMMGGGWDFLGPLAGDVPIRADVKGRRFFPPGSGLWVGQQGNITALHYDVWHGFLGQILGRKRVILFGPDESSKLYPDPPFGLRLASTRLPTACLSADRSVFPKVYRAQRWEAVLNAGDMLYIPPYWWHYVESLDDNVSLSLRYDATRREQFHPATFPVKYRTVFKPMVGKLRKIRAGT